jgi:Mn2+/Fe2+ NRAMP family transporter
MIIVFAAVVEFSCKIVPKVKRHIVVIIIALIFFILSMFALEINNFEKITEAFSLYLVLISSFLIPITVFILAKVKKRA